MKPVILMDVMGTIVSEPFRHEIPGFFGMTLQELQTLVNRSAWVEFEEGSIKEAEFFERFFSDGRVMDGLALRDCVQNAYRWLEGMEDLLAELNRAGYDIYALSNYPTWYGMIERALGLSRYLEWRFVSCLTGFRKPARESFLNAASCLDIAVSDCLFIDDRTVNVEAAESCGMGGILFQSAGQLRAELVRRELLSD